MKKRLLSLALALVMVCGLLPVTATAAATVTEIVPPKYDEVRDFSDGLAAVKVAAGEWSNGEAPVTIYKWGFIDKTGRKVVPPKYSSVGNFSDGLAAVGVGHYPDDKWGFIDKTGKEVVPCNYMRNGDRSNDVPEFHEGLAVVKGSTGEISNGKTVYATGVIDTKGNVVVPFGKYDKIGQFSDGLAAVRITVDTGEIDREGYHCVETKQGFIDTTGKEVVPCKYYANGDVPVFHEGLAVLGSRFIDTTGKEVVLHKEYTSVRDFSEGLAAVCVFDAYGQTKWGFVDKTGAEVVPCKYINDWYNIPEFHEGLAVVQTSNGWGCIDLHGNEVVPCQYGGAKLLSEGLVAVQVDGKWGILRVEGLPTEPKPAPAPTPTPTPQQPTTPASTTAYASTQTVTVDGKPVTFYAYALKDANGNDTNYIKLRDVAQILNGSAAQFQVGWDGSITITTKAAYTPNGTENIQNFKGNQTYAVSTSPVTVNGQPTNLEAITLTDANGGGYTYFKLRDLGAALGFDVDWTPEKGITVDSTKPYDGNN